MDTFIGVFFSYLFGRKNKARNNGVRYLEGSSKAIVIFKAKISAKYEKAFIVAFFHEVPVCIVNEVLHSIERT